MVNDNDNEFNEFHECEFHEFHECNVTLGLSELLGVAKYS